MRLTLISNSVFLNKIHGPIMWGGGGGGEEQVLEINIGDDPIGLKHRYLETLGWGTEKPSTAQDMRNLSESNI